MIDGGTLVAVLRMVVSLAIVLALLVGFVRFLDKRGIGRGRRGTGPAVEVLSRAPLGRSQSLQIVRIGDRILALGVTESSVRVLTDLERADLEGEAPAAIEGAADATDVSGRADVTDEDGIDHAAFRQAMTIQDVRSAVQRREGKHRVGRGGARGE